MCSARAAPQVCIAAGEYQASINVVDLMGRVGLQPEPEQEKRMLQACFDPAQIEKPDPSAIDKPDASAAGEGE